MVSDFVKLWSQAPRSNGINANPLVQFVKDATQNRDHTFAMNAIASNFQQGFEVMHMDSTSASEISG